MQPINYHASSSRQRRVVREEYVRRQEGKCYHCGGLLSAEPEQKPEIDWSLFPSNFLRWPVHLHHSHATGLTIGAVHAYCNAVLWQYHGE